MAEPLDPRELAILRREAEEVRDAFPGRSRAYHLAGSVLILADEVDRLREWIDALQGGRPIRPADPARARRAAIRDYLRTGRRPGEGGPS